MTPARVACRAISQPCAGPPGKARAPRRTMSACATLHAAARLRKGIPLAGLHRDDDLRGTRRSGRSTRGCPVTPARVACRAISQPCAGPPGKEHAPSRAMSACPTLHAAASLRKGILLAGLRRDDNLRSARRSRRSTRGCCAPRCGLAASHGLHLQGVLNDRRNGAQHA